MNHDDTISITAARTDEVPVIVDLLRTEQLPHGDLAAQPVMFLVARDHAGNVVGSVGAEVYGEEALLRSLVVAPAARGVGLGGRLVETLERTAFGLGVRRWWLLTATAERFFAARGFRVEARCAAPAAIRATGQFSGGCGSAAVCMTRECRGVARVT